MAVRSEDLKARLVELIAVHAVPGATAAVLHEGEVVEAAAGVLNLDTGAEATPDSLFQIGSTTKVYTATVVMQLVDEGLIQLDTPVRSVLDELRFLDQVATETVTVRHLLSHTSGVEGDVFEDFGRGDDALERFVSACAGLPSLHPVGERFSYCNTGWVVAGRLIERLTGLSWDAALRSRLLEPLGLRSTVTLPEEAILGRVAVGHLPSAEKADGSLVVTPRWMLPRSLGPAGLVVSTAAEVVRFAGLHLAEGATHEGTQLLTPASVKAMQEPQVQLADTITHAPSWGLGWFLPDWNGAKLLGHDGATIGQTAFLRASPDHGFAVALLTNGPAGGKVYRDLFAELFAEEVGITMPDLPVPAADLRLDAGRYVGTYGRRGVDIEISQADGGLTMLARFEGAMAEQAPAPSPVRLRPVDEWTFLLEDPSRGDTPAALVFSDPDASGLPQWLHTSARAHRRVR